MKPFTLNPEVEEAWKRVEVADDALRATPVGRRTEYLEVLKRLDAARDEYLRVRNEDD